MTNQTTHAGGLVVRGRENKTFEVLLVKRSANQRGFFLPNGKIEGGETELEAAHREVAEETGLTNLFLLRNLGLVHRTGVNEDRQRYNKVIRYFLFTCSDQENSNWKKEAEHGKTFYCQWVPLRKFEEKIQFLTERHLGPLSRRFLSNKNP